MDAKDRLVAWEIARRSRGACAAWLAKVLDDNAAVREENEAAQAKQQETWQILKLTESHLRKAERQRDQLRAALSPFCTSPATVVTLDGEYVNVVVSVQQLEAARAALGTTPPSPERGEEEHDASTS